MAKICGKLLGAKSGLGPTSNKEMKLYIFYSCKEINSANNVSLKADSCPVKLPDENEA